MKRKQYREFDVKPFACTLIYFLTEILPFTIRDNSVQRESVWSIAKRMGYVSTATIGSAMYTPIHLCDLKKLLECAKIAREWDFVELLEDHRFFSL